MAMFVYLLILSLAGIHLVDCRPYNDDDDICAGVPEGTVPDPKSCEGFYVCQEGEEPKLGKCPNGMWFDRERLQCDFPEFVKCDLESETTTTETELPSSTTSSLSTWSLSTTTTSSTPEPTSTTVTTPQPTQTTTVEITTSTRTTNTLPGIPITQGTVEPGIEEKCLDFDRDSVAFLASKIDCEKYYLCYMGKPVPLHCLSGHHWNQLAYFCDDPFYAHCQVAGWEDPNPFPECPRLGRSVVPHRTDCQYYIFCNDGVGSLNRCPYYYGYDVILQKCVLLDKARCYVHEE